MKTTLGLIAFLFSLTSFGQEVTVTIGYPDHEDYFIYSIPPTDEHARFGGEYYFKVENTGNVALNNWEMFMNWKALNSTWGVVEKTVINSQTGAIKLTGPGWDGNLDVGETIVLNGEWVPSASVEDWREFLPTNITMNADGAAQVTINYDTNGEVGMSNYAVQKVLPISDDRKTYSDLKVVAYFPIFDAENAWCSLQRYGANIDELRVQLYSISTDGVLRAGQDLPAGVDPIQDLDFWYDSIESLGVIDFCTNNGIEFVPVVYNYNQDIDDFDQISVHNMMTSPSVRTQHISDLLQLLTDHPEFDGIDIDYESLMASDRDNYSLFMEDVATGVHGMNKILTTAVHTKAGPGTWFGPQAQDYQRIGNAVDEMLIMTYDLHWGTSPTFSNPPPTAGCQGTPDWMNDVANFAISEIDDPSKIQLGLPFYGYRWKHMFENHTLNDPGVGLVYSDAQQLISDHGIDPTTIARDPNGNEPNFIVDINGQDWICFYQDEESIEYKLTALNESDLRDYIGGIGIWRIGGEDDQMWEAVTQGVDLVPAVINSSIDCSVDNSDGTSSVEQLTNQTVSIFPNPSNGKLTIQHSGTIIESIQVFSLTGGLVKDFGVNVSNSLETTLDMDTIEKGSYLLQLFFENGASSVHSIQLK